MSEETNQVDKEITGPQSNSAVLNAFKQQFAAINNVIHINSLDMDIGFKELTVAEQKQLSKVMIGNEERRDIVYDTQCQLINKLCTQDGFSIYRLTEFDRIKILMEIYQSNYMKEDITFKCKECGCENVYSLDFQKYINKMNEFKLEDVVFSKETKNHIFKFILNYPLVRNVSNFYKDYAKKYKNITSKERAALDDLGNVDYITLFIKSIESIPKDSPENRVLADCSILSLAELDELVSILPQDVLFNDKHGVLKFISDEFINKINSVFTHEKCASCGAESQEGLGSVADFF